MPTKRILVTGVSRDLGARFARALAADDDHVVLGADVTPPRHDLGRCSFVRADIRNPTIGKVIAAHAVDTVVHMAIVATPRSAGGRSSMKEINVIGTMQLLAACQKAETFRKLVVQSSVSVYGASFRDPARFTEDLQPAGAAADRLRQGLGRGRVLRPRAGPAPAGRRRHHAAAGQPDGGGGGQQRHPLPVAAGRAAGDGLRRPAAVPAPERRGRRAAPGHPRTTFPAPTTSPRRTSSRCPRCSAMLGRPSVGVPQPLAPIVAAGFRQARLSDFSADQIDALTYGRGMDTGRFTAATGFTPRYTSRAALAEFAASAPPGVLSLGRVDEALAAGRPARWASVDRRRDPRWLTRRSSSSAAAVPPAGAAGPARRPRRAGSPPSPPPRVRDAPVRRPRPEPEPGARPSRARARGVEDPAPEPADAPPEEARPTRSLGALLSELVRHRCKGRSTG